MVNKTERERRRGGGGENKGELRDRVGGKSRCGTERERGTWKSFEDASTLELVFTDVADTNRRYTIGENKRPLLRYRAD